MTNAQDPQQPQDGITPSRRDRLKPLELLGFSAVLAAFSGLVVALTRVHPSNMAPFAFVLTVVGIVFIVSVLVVALIGLGGKPSEEDEEARKDLNKPDGDWH